MRSQPTRLVFFKVFLNVIEMALLQRHLDVPGLEVTVDFVLLNTFPDNFITAVVQRPDLVPTKMFCKYSAPSNTPDQLSAITTRSTPADAVLFQHRHAQASFGECQPTSNTSKTAANDAHICFMLALEHRIGTFICARRRVIGCRVLFAARHVHSKVG